MDALRVFFLYFTVFVTGAVVLAVEILGARILAPFYGSTIFVWSSLITVTLGALALGYFSGGKLVDLFPRASVLFGIIILAAFALLSIVKLSRFVLVATDGLGIQYGPFAAAAALFFLPLFLLGTASPVVIRLLLARAERAGSVSGNVFAVGTIGSICGGLMSAFAFFPYFGLASVFYGMSAMLFLLGACGLFLFGSGNKVVVVALLSAIFPVVFSLPSVKYHDESKAIRILVHEQGWYGDMKILETGNLRCVAVDGGAQSCVELPGFTSFPVFREWARIVHSANPSSVLILGAGAGNLSSELSEAIPRVDLVDIDPAILRLSREHLGFAPKSNQHVTVADARAFLRTTSHQYDVIFSDVVRGGTIPTHLFTAESFYLFAQRLSPGGIAVLHILGGVGQGDVSMASILKTAQTIFPSSTLFTNKPDENLSYLLYLSLDPRYRARPPESVMPWIPAIVDKHLGIILTDNYNPLEVLWTEKSVLQLEQTRHFGGLESIFAL